MQMDKATIRDKILNIRSAMPESECLEKSAAILKKLDKLDAFLRAWKVGLYASTGNEVITYPLIGRAMMLDKGVAFPYIASASEQEMVFKYILSVTDLKPGPFKLLQPGANATVMEMPDVIIMPLVAFDADKNRIGHGGGYYDRYLKSHPASFKIALAYECQRVDTIEAKSHDIRPDLIITEEKIYE